MAGVESAGVEPAGVESAGVDDVTRDDETVGSSDGISGGEGAAEGNTVGARA